MIGSGGYMWYVSQFQPGQHPIAPDARTTFSTVNDLKARMYEDAAVADFQARLAALDLRAMAYNKQHAGDKSLEQIAMAYQLHLKFPGPSVAATAQGHLHELITTWCEPGAMNVVLNDDVTKFFAATRPLMNAVVQGFLDARYNRPSSFELLYEGVNNCK
jgi:hypothetical protein